MTIFLTINNMQQQIQIENQDHAFKKHIPIQEQQPPSLNEELISEHYEEDFDSISDISSLNQDKQIKEELSQEEQPPPDLLISHKKRRQSIEQQWIKKDCIALEKQILFLQLELQRKMNEYQPQNQRDEDSYQDLLLLKSSNEEQLMKQKKQYQVAMSNLLGKEAISIDFILNQNEQGENKLIQERLIDEKIRLKELIAALQNEILKTKRELNKNSSFLAISEEVKNETNNKYHTLFRQIEEKKQKIDNNDKKLLDQDIKIEELTRKLASVQNNSLLKDSKQLRLKQKWEDAAKDKERQNKKIQLAKKTTENSVQAFVKTVEDLHKQQQKLSLQIRQLQKQNSNIQQKSNKMLERTNKFQHLSASIRYQQAERSFPERDEKQQALAQNVSSKSPMFMLGRQRNYSVQRRMQNIRPNSFVAKNIDHFYGHQLLGPAFISEQPSTEENSNQLQNKLNQCSTDGALRKQFKLRLPKNSPSNSRKFIDIYSKSQSKESLYPKILSKKTTYPKLSVTERLERIQSLQREDRIHAYKMHAIKQQKSLKGKSKVNIDSQNDLKGIQIAQASKQIYRNQELYLNNNQTNIQKQSENPQISDYKSVSPESSPFDEKSQSRELDQISSNYLSSDGLYKEIEEIKKETNISLKRQKNIEKTLNENNKLAELGITDTQNLFSSIQQKLIKRETARQSFNPSNPDIAIEDEITTPNIENSSFLSLTRLSRQSSLLRKKSEIRQKRISDEYMRILEQRGRRILELDNEGD